MGGVSRGESLQPLVRFSDAAARGPVGVPKAPGPWPPPAAAQGWQGLVGGGTARSGTQALRRAMLASSASREPQCHVLRASSESSGMMCPAAKRDTEKGHSKSCFFPPMQVSAAFTWPAASPLSMSRPTRLTHAHARARCFPTGRHLSVLASQ